MAVAIIECAAKCDTPEQKAPALWAAAFSQSPKLLPILERSMADPNPMLQLMALYFLSTVPEDRATEIMKQGLISPFLEIRFQAAMALKTRKDPTIIAQVEQWVEEVPPPLRFLFVPFFASSDDRFATGWMRRFLHSDDLGVRQTALFEAIANNRDDLLPEIREIARTGTPSEQEMAAIGLGALGDTGSTALLQELQESTSPSVRLAASYSLWKFGVADATQSIVAAAKALNPFAIQLLGEMRLQLDLLSTLMTSDNLDVRMNAALALLKAKDARAIPGTLELLSPKLRNLSLMQTTSSGGALKAWTAIASVNAKAGPLAMLKSFKSKQQIVADAYELPASDFLVFARQALFLDDKSVIETTIDYVSQLQNEEARIVLEEQLTRPGAPTARTFATLALYTMDAGDEAASCVRNWLIEMKQIPMISVALPTLKTDRESFFQMTRMESSQLLLSAMEAMASKHDTKAIDNVLIALETGNPANRPFLASLLLRLSE